MSNPNNCETCSRKASTPYEDWCEIYRFQPTTPCSVHTSPIERSRSMRLQQVESIAQRYNNEKQRHDSNQSWLL